PGTARVDGGFPNEGEPHAGLAQRGLTDFLFGYWASTESISFSLWVLSADVSRAFSLQQVVKTAEGTTTYCQLCAEGLYSYGYPVTAETACSSCPEGGACPGGDSMYAVEGFWRASQEDEVMTKCVDEHCKGEEQETLTTVCREGHGGTLCSECAEEYALSGGLCEYCGDANSSASTWGFVIAAVCVVLFIGGITFFITKQLYQERVDSVHSRVTGLVGFYAARLLSNSPILASLCDVIGIVDAAGAEGTLFDEALGGGDNFFLECLKIVISFFQVSLP
ncbi:hypothetical protein CYMTET_31338, partial [Cymbomonas tetramitiformis]